MQQMEYLLSVLVILDCGNGHTELTVVGGVCLLGIFQEKTSGAGVDFALTLCNTE